MATLAQKPFGIHRCLDHGFKAAEHDGLPPVGVCISLLRQQTADEAIELVEALSAIGNSRIVALTVDGNEKLAGRTGPSLADAFRRAGAMGFKRTVHAGESSGPEGVRDAIDHLGADRIDHGVRAIEDKELVQLLVDRQIPLGVCPTSNLTLGLYHRMEDHPIERLRRAGVPVSVNTDDPVLLQVDLPTEYSRCTAVFGWNSETCREIATTSMNASFASADTKARLLTRVAAWQSP